MKYKVGDKVISTTLPPLVDSYEHEVGTEGTVVSLHSMHRIDGELTEYLVRFPDTEWYCAEGGLRLTVPLPSMEEALSGLMSILQEQGV